MFVFLFIMPKKRGSGCKRSAEGGEDDRVSKESRSSSPEIVSVADGGGSLSLVVYMASKSGIDLTKLCPLSVYDEVLACCGHVIEVVRLFP